ncbi:inactive ubiquitin carboxyl-terminal hydrolase 53 [Pelobates cultripes]|uniref:Inactive ubiquitin carboxyl-terminal hydrolase 53 n=1 Tax=Pelobates cultripes TaxID=61616 RepID=A0AAD1WE34_PELCU|nr:inactive ubiquitin carboxyl-terminal hydrolase 53 [Pelobates cultripes]
MAWVKLFRRQAGGNLGKVYQPGSMLSLAPTKGLFNEPGQNSCFLNSAVQVLWQLDIFRRSLRGLTGHVCLGDACIFCALKSLFTQFQTSREKVLPSDAMRHALAESFKDEHRFQLGLMDDAAECFENILQRIHFHIVPNSEGDMCTSKSCITHQKFAMTLYEQCVCRSCGASSDPLPFTEFVRYISTTALCNEVDRMLERHERLKPEMFAELLQTANTADDFRKCPSNCGQKIKIRRVLMNCPEIVTIGLVWDSENSDLTEDVVRNLATQLYLPGLFFRVTDEQAKESRLYLVGMICYTSKHYCAFAYHTKSARWVLFDDASVKEVGNKWKDVVTKCIRCHYQPLLLFYANPDGTAVTTEDALRHVLQWSHYKRVFNNEDTGNERTSKNQEYNREEFVEHVYQNSGPVLQMEDPGFNRGAVQSSAGRGPVKLTRNDQQEKFKDLSRECAQRAANLKGNSSSQRKTVDKVQKKEISRPKETSGGGIYQPKPYAGVQTKSGSSTAGTGFRHYPEPNVYHSQGKGPYKHERPVHQSKQPLSSTVHATAPEPKPVTRVKSSSAIGYDTDSGQDYRERGSNRNRKQWRPMRETLNVDSIFSENQKSPQSPRHVSNSNGKYQPVKDQSYPSSLKESPKRKVLMTIYEDEVKQESGSRSSLESVGKNQVERNKLNPDTKAYHLESWQMQRTESGYESSDHISSGSSNLDSPIIEGTSFADLKNIQETSICGDKLQPGNIILSTSPRTRRHLNGFNKENDGLEHRRCQDRLSPDAREQIHSPSGQRKQMMDTKRDPRSPNLLLVTKDYGLKDMYMNKSGDPHDSLNQINSIYSENCLPHDSSSVLRDMPGATVKVHSTNGFMNSTVQHPSAVSLTTSSPQPYSQNRLQYMNSNVFQFGESQTCSRDETSSMDNHNASILPPPLPPKKYRNAMPRTEQNVVPTMNSKLAETYSQAQTPLDTRLSNDLMRPETETDYYPRKDTFHNNELHIGKSNMAGSSMCECRSKMVPHDLGLDPVSPNGNDTVSLTTYFSVDNCMTDTYRLKYHQKPRMYMPENAVYNRDPFHLPEAALEPAYRTTFDHTHPSLVSRSKQSVGNIPCNR